MNERSFELSASLVPKIYCTQALEARRRLSREVNALLEHKRWPSHGWSATRIEQLLHDIAAMDSNNFIENVGVGEREARVASDTVRRRHYAFAHGVGRYATFRSFINSIGAHLLIR